MRFRFGAYVCSGYEYRTACESATSIVRGGARVHVIMGNKQLLLRGRLDQTVSSLAALAVYIVDVFLTGKRQDSLVRIQGFVLVVLLWHCSTGKQCIALKPVHDFATLENDTLICLFWFPGGLLQ